jgi:hypothetical protein
MCPDVNPHESSHMVMLGGSTSSHGSQLVVRLPSAEGEDESEGVGVSGRLLVWPKTESIGADTSAHKSKATGAVTLQATGAQERVVINATLRGSSGNIYNNPNSIHYAKAKKRGLTDSPSHSLDISDMVSQRLRILELDSKVKKRSLGGEEEEEEEDAFRSAPSAIRSIVALPSAGSASAGATSSQASPSMVAVLDNDGCVRLFETDPISLQTSLQTWKSMLGVGVKGSKFAQESFSSRSERDGNLLDTRDSEGTSDPRFGVDKPKHGKEDDKQHVGGNTWAGGSGGSDTAGLGGRGGPYRLDKGHKVHQVSEKDKQISAEAKARAAAMGKEAFEKRMKDIKMGKQEFENYEYIRNKVQQQANQLRQILEELNVRSQERIWMKNQTHGELDDSKLVDGLTGDRLVFKRRGVPEDFQEDSGDGNGPVIKKRYGCGYDYDGCRMLFDDVLALHCIALDIIILLINEGIFVLNVCLCVCVCVRIHVCVLVHCPVRWYCCVVTKVAIYHGCVRKHVSLQQSRQAVGENARGCPAGN